MSIFQRQPKRSVPEPVKPPQHGAVNPLNQSSGELDAFRSTILITTGGILALAILAYAVYGPWFAVRSVTVSGTREIVPQSVQRVTEKYLSSWRFGILPNKNLWLLSRKNLAASLEKKIRERISIEEVRVVKRNRHDLEVVVVERTPVALWKSGDQQGTIDRTGTIINTTGTAAALPNIVDAGNRSFTIGQQVLTEPAMAGWKTLNDAFKVSTLTVENYIIPVPVCPTKIIQPEDQNTNASQNRPLANNNLNADGEDRATNKNANMNSNQNGNTNTAEPIVVQTDCDLAAIAKASQEIHAKLKDGPLVLFDRHQDLALAVQTVKRLLTNPENSGASYIDIRFQERVYIK